MTTSTFGDEEVRSIAWMVDKGTLLELLHGAPGRWETFQAVCSNWRHTRRGHEAFARQWEGRGQRMRLRGRSGGREPETVEETVRVWVAGLERIRQEAVTGRRRGSVTVVDGDRWWLYDPPRGVLRHDSGKGPSVGTYDVASFLDPSVLIPHLEFGSISEGEVDRRGCWLVDTTPRQTLHEERYRDIPLVGGADRYRLWVDKERGTALRIEASWQGEPFSIREATEVVFDAELPDGLFEYEPPAGTAVFTTSDQPDVRQVSVEEAARLAPFTVLVPSQLPAGSSIEVSFAAGGGFDAQKPMVTIHAWEENPRRGLRIMEMATSDAWDDSLEWRPTQHRRDTYMINDEAGERMVRLDRHGTRVQLSGPYDLNVLLNVAASLQPASKTSPPLTP